MTRELVLAYSQKAINETAGPNGLVTVVLVYDESMPRYRAAGLASRFEPNSSRFKAMQTAREEYTTIVNQDRVQRFLRKPVPPAADRQLTVGQQVSFWREQEKDTQVLLLS